MVRHNVLRMQTNVAEKKRFKLNVSTDNKQAGKNPFSLTIFSCIFVLFIYVFCKKKKGINKIQDACAHASINKMN